MKQFGLIGKSLVHSFSKKYFDKKYEEENIQDSTYSLFELSKIMEIEQVFNKPNLIGLNVTNPYKESVISYLTKIDPIAEEIGAVNTIFIKGYERIGFNTDIIGFKKSIRPFLAKEHTRALILGTGGASKSIAVALKQYDINFFYVSRSKPTQQNIINYSDLDEQIISTFPLIINCTPIGTFPKVNELPPIPIDGIGMNHLIFDLVYNPAETALLLAAKKRGALVVNGLNMLRIQAEESWKLWNKK